MTMSSRTKVNRAAAGVLVALEAMPRVIGVALVVTRAPTPRITGTAPGVVTRVVAAVAEV